MVAARPAIWAPFDGLKQAILQEMPSGRVVVGPDAVVRAQADLGDVRAHTDSTVAASAGAYTVGTEIAFDTSVTPPAHQPAATCWRMS